MISPSVSTIWDRVQSELQCCGVNSYEDWYFIENWPREKWVPKSCCRTRISLSTDVLYEGSGSDYIEEDCRKYEMLWNENNAIMKSDKIILFLFFLRFPSDIWLNSKQKTTTRIVVEPGLWESSSSTSDSEASCRWHRRYRYCFLTGKYNVLIISCCYSLQYMKWNFLRTFFLTNFFLIFASIFPALWIDHQHAAVLHH